MFKKLKKPLFYGSLISNLLFSNLAYSQTQPIFTNQIKVSDIPLTSVVLNDGNSHEFCSGTMFQNITFSDSHCIENSNHNTTYILSNAEPNKRQLLGEATILENTPEEDYLELQTRKGNYFLPPVFEGKIKDLYFSTQFNPLEKVSKVKIGDNFELRAIGDITKEYGMSNMYLLDYPAKPGMSGGHIWACNYQDLCAPLGRIISIPKSYEQNRPIDNTMHFQYLPKYEVPLNQFKYQFTPKQIRKYLEDLSGEEPESDYDPNLYPETQVPHTRY